MATDKIKFSYKKYLTGEYTPVYRNSHINIDRIEIDPTADSFYKYLVYDTQDPQPLFISANGRAYGDRESEYDIFLIKK